MGPKLGTQNGFNFINEKNEQIYEYMIRCFGFFNIGLAISTLIF